jgi:hypothetical protein
MKNSTPSILGKLKLIINRMRNGGRPMIFCGIGFHNFNWKFGCAAFLQNSFSDFLWLEKKITD